MYTKHRDSARKSDELDEFYCTTNVICCCR